MWCIISVIFWPFCQNLRTYTESTSPEFNHVTPCKKYKVMTRAAPEKQLFLFEWPKVLENWLWLQVLLQSSQGSICRDARGFSSTFQVRTRYLFNGPTQGHGWGEWPILVDVSRRLGPIREQFPVGIVILLFVKKLTEMQEIPAASDFFYLLCHNR